jgi:hypothetical protein
MNGSAESGKGTVVKYIKESFDLKVEKYSSILYVKEVARDKFGWDGKKDEKGRNLLSALKQCSIAYNDLPTLKVVSKVKSAFIGIADVLVVDIREPDEIEKLVKYCNSAELPCFTCRILNAKAEKIAEKSGLSLTGDRLYGKYDYDILINNNGTLEELKGEVIQKFHKLFENNSDT